LTYLNDWNQLTLKAEPKRRKYGFDLIVRIQANSCIIQWLIE